MSNSLDDRQYYQFIDNLDGTFSSKSAPAFNWNSNAECENHVAPIAGTTLAQAQAIAGAGNYDVQVLWGYGATAESTTVNNFQLTIQGTPFTTLIAPVSTPNLLLGQGVHFKLKLNNNDFVRVGNASNGSAGSVYLAMIILTRES